VELQAQQPPTDSVAAEAEVAGITGQIEPIVSPFPYPPRTNQEPALKRVLKRTLTPLPSQEGTDPPQLRCHPRYYRQRQTRWRIAGGNCDRRAGEWIGERRPREGVRRLGRPEIAWVEGGCMWTGSLSIRDSTLVRSRPAESVNHMVTCRGGRFRPKRKAIRPEVRVNVELKQVIVLIPLAKILIFLETPFPDLNADISVVRVRVRESQQRSRAGRWAFEDMVGGKLGPSCRRKSRSRGREVLLRRTELGDEFFLMVLEAGQPCRKGVHGFGSDQGGFPPGVKHALGPERSRSDDPRHRGGSGRDRGWGSRSTNRVTRVSRRDLAHARIGGAFDPFLRERESGSL